MSRVRCSSSRGSSLLELMVVLGLMATIMGIGVTNLMALDDPLQDSSYQLLGFVKQVRARAISTTSAYVIEPESPTRIVTRYANNCEANVDDFEEDQALDLDLSRGITMIDIEWAVCFSARGLADANPYITLTDGGVRYRSVEVFLGGAVRIEG